jgi:HlyD family secretion protein
MKFNPFKVLDPDYSQDHKDGSKYDESVLQQGRFWMRTVTWTLIGTTAFGIAWLAIAQTEEIVVAKGQLEPVGSVQDIQMPVGGVVDDILVKEGDSVEKGEILMQLDTEASEQQRQSLESSIKLKGVERKRYSEMNNAEIQMLGKNLILQLEILDRYRQLELAGAESELRLLSQQNTVEETRGRLMTTKADGFRQLALLDQQLAELKSRLAEVRVTLRYQQLKSPVDGVVFDLQPTASGFTAQSTQTVMKVVPFGALEAKVEVPSNKIGFVKIPVGCPKQLADCMNADISIDSYPSTDFGVIEGKVTSIASDALAPDQQEQRQEYSFPVTIQLNKQLLELKSGSELPLQVGMSLTANIKLRKVSYLQLLLGEFQDNAVSLLRL